ncbi:MAG: flagellar hook-length control protein FliK [Pseudomonadota bacterium]
MNQNITISSPQARLADIFFNGIQADNQFPAKGQQVASFAQTFNQVLENSKRLAAQAEDYYSQRNFFTTSQSDDAASPKESREASSADRAEEKEKQRAAREELKKRIEGLGLPLNQLSISRDSIELVKKVMADGGLDAEAIEKTLSKLGEGSVTMDKIVAAMPAAGLTSGKSLKLSQESVPQLGRFLQELGLKPETVQNAVANLKPGQKFGAEDLRNILLKDGKTNLNLKDLSQVDQGNLRDLFQSLGMEEKDLDSIMTKVKQTNGRVSLESLLAGMKSTAAPDSLSSTQMENIRQLMQNMNLTNTVQVNISFDRTLSLIQSMGDGEADSGHASETPGVQALRGGSQAAQKISSGVGVVGQSDGKQEQSADFGQTGNKGETDYQDAASTETGSSKTGAGVSKTAEAGPSRYISEAIIRQIADRMAYQVRNSQHRLQLQLTPANLGKIDLDLVMKDDQLRASIVAESPAVKQVLEDQVERLRESLAQQGVKLESIEISLSEDYRQADARDNGRRDNSSVGRKAGAEEEAVSLESQDGPNKPVDGALVDLLA